MLDRISRETKQGVTLNLLGLYWLTQRPDFKLFGDWPLGKLCLFVGIPLILMGLFKDISKLLKPKK